MKKINLYAVVLLLLVLNACNSIKHIEQSVVDIKSISLLGTYEIPHNLKFDSTTVGGLSGIDYDAKKNIYYFICDDRSDKNPARFYTARIDCNQQGINNVELLKVHFMLQANGQVYPNNKQDALHTPDPESIRYNPITNQLVWSSEGERIVKAKDTILEDPSIHFISVAGNFAKSIPLPANLRMQSIESGPRQNGVLEGMSFADNYKTLYVNVEEPLYEDGPRADLTENGAYIRINQFDVKTGSCKAQYAYKLEPIAHPPTPPTAFKVNGVPEILSIGNHKLLVMERSFSTGILPCTIRLFIADLSAATDISQSNLKENTNFIPATKRLLLNMDDLGIYTDNVEGVCFGPVLPNGHKTLVFVADNNFNPLEKSQLFLFEIKE